MLGSLTAALFFLVACAPLPAPTREIPKTLFFPLPPDEPRIQYLGSISSSADLPSESGGFKDFLLGKPESRFPLMKPISAVLSGARLFVCDTKLNTVVVYDFARGQTRRLRGDRGVGKIRQPNNLSVDDEGKIYVADKLRGAVLVYGPDEEYLAAWGRPGETAPVAVALGGGNLYVCDIKDHEVEVWDGRTGEFRHAIGQLGFGDAQFAFPTNLATDAEGNLYVSDTFNFRVKKLSPDGKVLHKFGRSGRGSNAPGNFARPKGVDVDGHGRLYVADSLFANVQVFNSEGQLLLFFGGPGKEMGNLDLPAGLSVAPWPAIPWFNRRLSPGFDPEYLVIVVNQWQDHFINFFAVAREKAVTP